MHTMKILRQLIGVLLAVLCLVGCNLPVAGPVTPVAATFTAAPAESLQTQTSPPSGPVEVTGTAEAAPAAVAAVKISLDTPQQIFHYQKSDAMGLFNVPDMHTAVLQEPDKSYLLWITGNIGPSGGSVARLATKDFIQYTDAGPAGSKRVMPVFTPSCPDDKPACLAIYDAKYVGANSVVRASNGKDLLMFYEAGNQAVGDQPVPHWEYNVMALALSTDEGLTWTRRGPVVSGSDPTPTAVGTSQPGISEPGIVVAKRFMYMFFQYVPNQDSEPEAPSVIQAARASLASDGAPGAWKKYYNGAWTEDGLGGKASTIVATGKGSGCTRPVQVWPVFSDYLNAYVLTFLCNEGWFFSTSTDLVTWTAPVNFMPMPMWRSCQPMDWNFILVTPGKPAGVIGQTGLVLYAHSDQKGLNCGNFDAHELWVRGFKFQ